MARPGKRDLDDVYRGDNYAHTVTFVDADRQPIDVSDATWLAQVRVRRADEQPTVTFTVTTTDAASGVIVLTLSPTQTRELAGETYVWDLQRTMGGIVETLLAGALCPHGDVSR